ncbi:MAG: acyl carrier protein [Polyangiaceae bacterium]
MKEEVRKILHEHARLKIDARDLAEDADLYQAGMTTRAGVEVMLALENQFDIEFPDRLLTPRVFGSVATLSAAVAELVAVTILPQRPTASA